jgi:hypothetical protein
MAKNPWILPEGFDANDEKARKELARLLGGMGGQIPPEALEALRSGNIQQFQQLVNFDALGDQFEPMRELMQGFAAKSGASIYRQAKVSQQLVFDLIDERAVKWAETSSARLVREVTDEARQNIASLTAQATNGEITYQGMADLLESGGLGLTSRNARAVANSESRNFARFMNDGMSETAARIKARRMAEEYTDKLVQSRAKTIARTEIADAAMQGRYMGWESGVQSGVIDSNSVKEWIAEPDACSICSPLDGQLVSWDASYGEAVTGTTDKMPPAHPNCRCTVAILPPDYADTVFTDQADATPPVSEEEAMEMAKVPPNIDMTQPMMQNLPQKEFADIGQESFDTHKQAAYRIMQEEYPDAGIEVGDDFNTFGDKVTDAGYPDDFKDTVYRGAFQDAYYADEMVELRSKYRQTPFYQRFANVKKSDGTTFLAELEDLEEYGQKMSSPLYEKLERPYLAGSPNAYLTKGTRKYDFLKNRSSNSDILPNTLDEAIATVKPNLDEALEAPTVIMMQPNKAKTFINQGRYKNIHATGGKRPSAAGASGVEYVDNRRLYEYGYFGYSDDVAAELRPVYGMKQNTAMSNLHTQVYGNVEIVLKPAVDARTTFTIGDSLNDFIAPQPLRNYDAKVIFNEVDGATSPLIRASEKVINGEVNYFLGDEFYDYIETQVHGGVSTDDVAEVVFHGEPDFGSPEIQGLTDTLDSKGIPWREAD